MPLYNSVKDLIHQRQKLFVPQAFKLKEIKSSHSCKPTNRISALKGVGDKGNKTKVFPRQISPQKENRHGISIQCLVSHKNHKRPEQRGSIF